jgi:hypothetical protein
LITRSNSGRYTHGGGLLSLIGLLLTQETSTVLDERLLARETVSFTLAGVWEELGFRFAFIPYAMIAVIVCNWLWSVGVGYFLVFIFAALTVGALFMRDTLALGRVGISLVCALLAFACYLWAEMADPIFWIYDNFMFPVANFMTAYMMSDVLGTPEKFGYLFVVGAFAANIKFRDGHKYQGPIGFVNSWYSGMIFLYAMLTYGIWVAIFVHASYNVLLSLTRYAYRKTFGRRMP